MLTHVLPLTIYLFIYCSSPSHRDAAQKRPGRRQEGHDDLLHLLHQGKPAAKAHLEQGARPDAGGGGEIIMSFVRKLFWVCCYSMYEGFFSVKRRGMSFFGMRPSNKYFASHTH